MILSALGAETREQHIGQLLDPVHDVRTVTTFSPIVGEWRQA